MIISGFVVKTSMLPLQHCSYRNWKIAMHSFRKPGLDQLQIRSYQDPHGSFRQQCKMLLLGDHIDNIFTVNGSIQLLLEQNPGNILIFGKAQIVLAGVNFRIQFLRKGVCQC